MLACRLLGILVFITKLVFTSYCICFYYIMICPVSSLYTISVVSFAWSRCIDCWLWTGHYFSFLFTVLFANLIMISSRSRAHVLLVLSCYPSALAADCEQVIVSVICFLPCLLTRYWFVSCQQHMCHWFYLLCIDGVLTDFEQVIFLVLLYLALFVN